MKDEKSTSPFRGYARASGVAVQMAAIIALSSVGGVKLDEWLQLKPLFTIVCSLAGVALALYVVIKDFIPKNNKDNKKS